MGEKLLVALTMEGKLAGEGLQNIDKDDDMLWRRNSSREMGSGNQLTLSGKLSMQNTGSCSRQLLSRTMTYLRSKCQAIF